MKSFQSIPPDKGVAQWNDFFRQLPVPPPLSFNPSLFDFYTAYFHWKPYYFLLFDGDRLEGLFPLVDTGRALVSLPHFSYGGLLTANEDCFDTASLIAELTGMVVSERPEPGFWAYDFQGRENADKQRIHIKENCFVRGLRNFEGTEKSDKLSSFVQLSGGTKEMLALLSPNLRRKLRKGMADGLETTHGGKELLDDFYKLYAQNMHKLGSPVYAKAFFRSLLETCANGEARLFVTTLNGRPAGAAFLMSYFGFFENTWFATDARFHKHHVSDHLHWQMLSHAIQKKGKIYSLGRSTVQGGVHRYKSHWPVDDRPLYFFPEEKQQWLKKQRWLSSAWKKLPFGLTLVLGPRLVRHIY